ncbi:hypothetical protein CXB51_018466 [Gossypium anomalum]|uniref:Uncharacterized protein n=1 Tax=Gossypium anomalum TaxID=47600 RepID=A0A8J5YLX2_9ROSI|nr:hypothetical protein CXB51_018466 [Gossypium anomalum]
MEKEEICSNFQQKVVELEHKLKEHVPLSWPSLLHTEGKLESPYLVLNTLSICHEPMCTIKEWEVVVMELWGKKRRRNLAGERAKEIRVLQVSIACRAEVAGASELPCLWPLV